MVNSCCAFRSRRAVPGFDGLDGVFKRPFQNALADGPEYKAEQPSLEVLALANDDHVNVGRAVGPTREGVGVTRRASPSVGVGRREDDAVGIGPVVVQALPDAARAFRNVGLRAAPIVTFRYSSALLPNSFERPGPKSVSPATYCSGVKMVVRWRWIVDISAPYFPRFPGV